MRNICAFIGGDAGTWTVTSQRALCGEPLAEARAVERVDSHAASPGRHDPAWLLRGQPSNIRYATRAEVTTLGARQEPLGRPEARRAALIPIAKSAAWWSLAQDERRAIFEETSHHTAIGLDYLPAVARQLFHSRDLGEPFDFLTWFEFAPEHEAAFDALLRRLRASTEWTYVEREVEIRLRRS